MGIWGFIGSTTEAVKRNAPDATPVTNACKSSYSYTAAAFTKVDEAVAAPVKNACISSYTYGSAAVTKIDQTVRVNGVYKLGQWMPDDEAKSKIGMYALKFAKNAGIYALHEGYKLLPGGAAFSKIIRKTANDVQFENLKSEKLKALEENVGSSKKHLSSDSSEMIVREEKRSPSKVVTSLESFFFWVRGKYPKAQTPICTRGPSTITTCRKEHENHGGLNEVIPL
ncbi:hypothetical protein ACS0TY_017244 [Phlomoides rotata]